MLAAEGTGEALALMTWFIFGAAVIGRNVEHFTWEMLVYAILSLTVIRMLPIFLSLTGTGENAASKLFLGWFGPRGLATIVFALTVVEDSALGGTRRIVDVATMTVLLSVFAHGLTAPWLVGRYARWFEANRSDLTFETEHVAALRPTRSRWVGAQQRPDETA